MIFLDTHAVIWLLEGDKRMRILSAKADCFWVSPMVWLELQYLIECGAVKSKVSANHLLDDERFQIHSPDINLWFQSAQSIGWTGDVFDRLIVANVISAKSKLATADRRILQHVSRRFIVEL